MKPEIENLKAWIYGKSTTGYQRALGMREFEQLLSYVNELEQLRQPHVRCFQIDFGNHLRCKLKVESNQITVEGAMNGWGDGIPLEQVVIVELQ